MGCRCAAADRAEDGDLPKWETIDEPDEDSDRGGAFFIASSAQANILYFRKLTCDDIAKGRRQHDGSSYS